MSQNGEQLFGYWRCRTGIMSAASIHSIQGLVVQRRMKPIGDFLSLCCFQCLGCEENFCENMFQPRVTPQERTRMI